ncbi:ribokinase [Desulfosediminicola flagellatus]|uniref:ribokinase n=1 Tax=Desulfosediminicola flagellatus TaxID=2569541 RepID=UPI0010AB5B7B|nr:ribokinase [Desulfosediminicola flagellatus]
MAIVVFGSINIDLVTYSQTLPRPGETLHGKSYAIGLGGKGCNQAAAVAALNGDVRLVGRIGTDDFGRTATALLRENSVPTKHITVDNTTNTGLAVIGVDGDGQNCITVIGGANMAINEQDVHSNQSLFEKAELLLLQMEIPLSAAMQAADLVRSAGGRVIFDPAPAPKDGLPAEVLERIDIITPNETETELLTGIYPSDETEAARAAQILLDKGVQVVLVKMGARGVCYCSRDKNLYIPPFQVTPIDTVAAGDCFNGGLAYALSKGREIEDAVRFASACGALSTTKAGASSSTPTLDEVESFLKASS